MNDESPPPAEDEPAEGNSSGEGNSGSASGEPNVNPEDAGEWFGQTFDELSDAIGENPSVEMPGGPGGGLDFGSSPETLGESNISLDPSTGAFEVEGAARGCLPTGGCLGLVVLVGFLIAASIVIFNPFSVLGGNSSGSTPAATSQDEAAPSGGESAPTPLADSDFEDVYNEGGQLVPIPGIWDISNGTGVDTCLGDIPLEANLQRVQMEVLSGGETLRVREITADGQLGPPFEFERESGNELEAVYYADFSEETGRDSERFVTFNSSYTMGSEIEGCANRGADGWLVELSE